MRHHSNKILIWKKDIKKK